jgi:hypothetical protein
MRRRVAVVIREQAAGDCQYTATSPSWGIEAISLVCGANFFQQPNH